ncbi:hypothetical protein H6G64_21345 [Calothrix sp. FACHB-156]|nr:hypothetical protein [Nostoc linckia FACHB-104]MBD2339521.1 hypothetical protein [Calothrix sp. FACHB-156]
MKSAIAFWVLRVVRSASAFVDLMGKSHQYIIGKVRARHPQACGEIDRLSVPCPYNVVAKKCDRFFGCN